MNKIIETLRKDRLYILLLIFIILINVAATAPVESKGKTKAFAKAEVKSRATAKSSDEDMAARQRKVEELFNENRALAITFGLAFLLFIAILLLGIAIDAIFISYKISGKQPDMATFRPGPVAWNLWDVSKVAILFFFFGYMAILIEASLVRVFPLLKNDNFRMVLNSSVLDALTILFILYFAVRQYKERLISLGISLKNFGRNVFYGIAGYIAVLPVLLLLVVLTLVVSNIFKYVPQKQPVVEIFLKEKNLNFLLYTSVFAAVVGPVIEELFFRGFMYNALKKYIGVFGAMCLTAAIFAGLHAHVAGFLPIMALGMFLAYIYERTGTLVSSITVHIAHNLSMVFFVFLIKQLGVM